MKNVGKAILAGTGLIGGIIVSALCEGTLANIVAPNRICADKGALDKVSDAIESIQLEEAE